LVSCHTHTLWRFLRHTVLALLLCCAETFCQHRTVAVLTMVGPIPWGHSGPLCHTLSLLSMLLMLLWTSMRRRHLVNGNVKQAACGGSQWRMGPTFFKCFLFTSMITSHAAVSSRSLRCGIACRTRHCHAIRRTRNKSANSYIRNDLTDYLAGRVCLRR